MLEMRHFVSFSMTNHALSHILRDGVVWRVMPDPIGHLMPIINQLNP